MRRYRGLVWRGKIPIIQLVLTCSTRKIRPTKKNLPLVSNFHTKKLHRRRFNGKKREKQSPLKRMSTRQSPFYTPENSSNFPLRELDEEKQRSFSAKIDLSPISLGRRRRYVCARVIFRKKCFQLLSRIDSIICHPPIVIVWLTLHAREHTKTLPPHTLTDDYSLHRLIGVETNWKPSHSYLIHFIRLLMEFQSVV